MLTPDQINGAIELCGAYFTWKNFAAYARDRELVGVYWPSTAFFTLWGLWNLYYYPAIGQPLSFLGGIALVGGNLMWIAYVLWDKLMRRSDAAIDLWPIEHEGRGTPSYCRTCEEWGITHRGFCDDEGSLSK